MKDAPPNLPQNDIAAILATQGGAHRGRRRPVRFIPVGPDPADHGAQPESLATATRERRRRFVPRSETDSKPRKVVEPRQQDTAEVSETVSFPVIADDAPHTVYTRPHEHQERTDAKHPIGAEEEVLRDSRADQGEEGKADALVITDAARRPRSGRPTRNPAYATRPDTPPRTAGGTGDGRGGDGGRRYPEGAAAEEPEPSNVPKPVIILRHLRDRIASGSLPPGTVVPSEPQLAERYGISRSSAGLVVRALQVDGLVDRQSGSGTWVRDQNAERPERDQEGDKLAAAADARQSYREQIASGALQPEDKFPSVIDIREQKGLTFTDAQVVSMLLASEGLVEGRGSKGIFVTGTKEIPDIDTIEFDTPRPVGRPRKRIVSETAVAESRRVNVLAEVQWAGRLLQQVRREKKHTQEDVGKSVGLSPRDMELIESGTKNVDLNRIFKAAIATGMSARDPRMVKIDELRQNMNWLRTLNRPGMTRGRAMDYLRLEQGMHETEYGKAIGVDRSLLSEYITETKKPHPSSLREILTKAGIDPKSKAGSMFFLLNEGMKPKSLKELAQSGVEEKLLYIRTSLGLSQSELGALIHYSFSSVSKFELGANVTPEAIRGLARLVNIPAPTLTKLLSVEGEEAEQALSDSEITDLLRGSLLLEDHILQAQEQPYWLPPEEEALDRQVQLMTRRSEIGRFLRIQRRTADSKRYSFRGINNAIRNRRTRFDPPVNGEAAIAPIEDHEVINISDIERGTHNINARTFALYLYGLDIEFHSPTAQHALEAA